MQDVFQKSRIEPLHFSPFGKDHRIDILRDDLIHPLVSGNKWRKLKYIIKDMLKHGKNRMVTFGGAYSNHLVATAFTGKHFNLKTFAFIRGDEMRALNKYEHLCIENGMEFLKVSRSAYRDKEKLYRDHFGDDPFSEMVGEGGLHPMALKGCEEILLEIDNPYDYILLPVGTGTTMHGLVKAVSASSLNTKIMGISSLKNNTEPDLILSKYPTKNWQMEYGYHRGKYAKKDTELLEFMELFKSQTGIGLEFVYTGKMMLALFDLLSSGKLETGKRILCIHTGGLFLNR